MKFNAILSLLAIASVGAVANTVSWNIDNLDTTGLSGDKTSTQWQYVFLTQGQDGLTRAGENTYVDNFEFEGSTLASGTWEDNANSSATYVVALWDGATPEVWNVFKNGDQYLTVAASDIIGGGGDAPVSDLTSGTLEALNAGPSNGALTLGNVSYSAQAVPEPATAALAFVGVAMLIRRRK